MKSASDRFSRGDATRSKAKQRRSRRAFDPWLLARWLSIAVIALSGFLLVRSLPIAAVLERASRTVEGLGSWGPIGFAGLYVIVGLLFVPVAALTLAAGALFGPWIGTLVASAAGTTSAVLAFLIARYMARDAVARSSQRHPTFAAIDRAIKIGGWKVLALMQMSPIVPFSLGNYFFGVTGVSLRSFVFASWIGRLPRSMVYVYLGHVGSQAVGGQGEGASAAWWWLFGLGLLASVIAALWLSRLARRELLKYGRDRERGAGEAVEPSSTKSTHRGSTFGLAGAALAMAFAAWIRGAG
jgi:uncharacterized membrane protein YdjX (TVP38/TMEM64 family)